MNLAAIVEAMVSSGCSPEQISEVVRAHQNEADRAASLAIQKAEDRREEKRALARERQRQWRERNANNALLSVTASDSTLQPAITRYEASDASVDAGDPAPALVVGLLNNIPPSDTTYPHPPKPKRSPAGEIREILSAVLSAEIAAGVIDHRQKLRKPLTALAARGLARDFAATGSPDAAAQMMIERGWQGFKPEWFANDRSAAAQPRASPNSGPTERTFDLGGEAHQVTERSLKHWLDEFKKSGQWRFESPKPGEPGCKVPIEFLPPDLRHPIPAQCEETT